MMIDDEWCCLRCGKKVDAIARHVEVAPDKALDEKADQEDGEESEDEETEEQVSEESKEKTA